MTPVELQSRLRSSGRYAGALDGKLGPISRNAILLAMTDGPDTRLTAADLAESAKRLGVSEAHMRAVDTVEAAGTGFTNGRATILFEPHRFSKATKRRFDATHPQVSYVQWDKTKYPKEQAVRYAQLVEAVCLDVDAGFASASYGRFQILGENFKACGFASSFDFAEAHAFDERRQLMAFERFLGSTGIDIRLRAAGRDPQTWRKFAERYNGPAYRLNKYDERLAKAYVAAGGK